MDAAIENMVEVGYAGTTIRAVTERAGVSQGAQSHHFPNRLDLIASAFERLAEQRIERYADRTRELSGDRATVVRTMLDLLWEDFSSSVFTVAAKLWVAAADDEELRERLIPVERRINAARAKVIRDLAGEVGDDPGFERKVAVATNTIAGLALVREFDPSGRARRGDPWPYHRAALERMLAP